MATIYTENEWNEVYQEISERGWSTWRENEFEIIETWDHDFSGGKANHVFLRSGLQVDLFEHKHHQPWAVDRAIEENPFVTLAFAIKGSMQVSSFGVKENYCEQPGKSYLFYIDQVREIEQVMTGHWLNVRIRVAPSLLRGLSAGREALLPDELKALLNTDSLSLFHRAVGQQTSAMQNALWQLLHCPLQGVMRQFYLEAKVLELIALQFAQLADTSSEVLSPEGVLRLAQSATPKEPRTLKSDDHDRIYQARDILLRHAAHPPTVIDLARQVGLNEFKLQQGFQHLFGNTVFGCLREHQMQEARSLLLEGNITVAGVATRVGYASRTAFNAAFSKQFGMSPKEFQQTNRIR
ncbi:helix-turn-helix transcriptional regulator [Myxacorys almedinensis]|uniref:Helix-turn-helix domain-containing protein n=1 Tax=Myxacorys almedinensis A TaxID=2690445 RepID=A0A8J8CN64_9CYAN|nr:AraC family transcriptional regulator [Myxacorys almedinensis]NDJ19280.1 helix-turn-helix domain-containing protein [Myxacorys almedinensis A]